MSIEDIIQMIKDCKLLASNEKEAKLLEKRFISNFKKEYKIIER